MAAQKRKRLRIVRQAGSGPSAATLARVAAKLSEDEAAKLVRICPAYLRSIERYGNAPYALARRLSTLYGCPMTVFLYSDLGGRTLK